MSQIYGNKAMFLRVGIGSCTDNDGNEYEMELNGGVTPAVQSKQTGFTFVLDWRDIVRMAVEAGIDDPNTEVLT